jgi:hypothetical protein
MISITILSAATAVIAVLLTAGYVLIFRPWHLRWGSTNSELTEPLPGDEVKPMAGTQVTHAITIDTTPTEVWKWLVQIGQDRGGFFSYDWIESLFGLRIHNLEELRPELQDIKAGDFIRSAPIGWLGGRFDSKAGWHIVEIKPESALVLRDEIENGSWSFILRPAEHGKTRLIIRARGNKPRGLIKFFHYFFFEPAHFIMERKMLLTLKRLAENSKRPNAAKTQNALNSGRGIY